LRSRLWKEQVVNILKAIRGEFSKNTYGKISKSSSICVQTNHRKKISFYYIYCNTNHIHPKVEENIIITSGYASQPKERGNCQLVGCNTNERKAVIHVTSHGQ
jgi:hypothetical protein